MNKWTWLLAMVVVLTWGAAGHFSHPSQLQTAYAQEDGGDAGDDEGPPQFVGVDRCKTCHKKESAGEQYRIWQESKHAQAYEVLGTDEARQVAAARGIDNPQEAGECLRCHVTAYGEPEERLHKKFDATQGVQCESCHGAGGDYWKEKVMKDRDAAVAAGLVIPTEETCIQCHNAESPSFDPETWNYEERYAEIAHPVPEEDEEGGEGHEGH